MNDSHPRRLAEKRATTERLLHRARALKTLRSVLDDRGFTECDPPELIRANAVEANIDPVVVDVRVDFAGTRAARQLHTSPELALKKTLAHTELTEVYALGHVFRQGELTERHRPEFTLLEWYRVRGSLDDLIDDVRAILSATDLYEGEIDVVTVDTLFGEHLELDLLAALERGTFVDDVRARDISLREGADVDDAFFQVMAECIEPKIGRLRPIVVKEWPARYAALAKIDGRIARRFEIYFRGLELCNAFDELTDTDEQRARFVAENARRRARGAREVPLDEDFLAALADMPPAVGIALGVERLMMLDGRGFEDALYFPDVR